MFKNLYNKFFPSRSFGLDISEGSIKFVEFIATKNGIKLGRYGEHKIPAGVVEYDEIRGLEQIKKILISLKKQEKMESAHISLPVTISEDVIQDYFVIFAESGISISSFKLEAEAIVNAIIKKEDLETYMIVDFGKRYTGVSIISRRTVIFASTIDMHGMTLPGLCGKISKYFLFWSRSKDKNEENYPSIAKIIVCGDNPNLAGLSEYLSANMKIKTESANVWANVFDTEKHIPEITFEKSLLYATAIGLALENFRK